MNEMEIHDDAGETETLPLEFEQASHNGSANGPPGTTRAKQQQQQQSANTFASLSMMGEPTTDQLERCGKWLATIPRDDITILRQTVEFQEFLRAVERLGHAHLRVSVNNQATVATAMETKEEQPKSQLLAIHTNDNGTAKQEAMTILPNETNKKSDSTSSNKTITQCDVCNSYNSNRKINTTHDAFASNFLRFTDDILLRVLEFLQCRSLIQTSLTCSRLHQLVTTSATRRTYDIASARQLGNVMQLLRAKEQMYYVDFDGDDQRGEGATGLTDANNADDDDDAIVDATDERFARAGVRSIGFSVPVPFLLLGRRLLVTKAGDLEYNGVYYCTGCDDNGFVFTKPRFSSHQTTSQHHVPGPHQLERMVQSGLPLRCIISKKFSDNNLWWYMSKELETTMEGGGIASATATSTSTRKEQRRSTTYSFFAPLVTIGNTPAGYPSQTSSLLLQNQAWGYLRGDGIEAPTLEVIDDSFDRR